MKGLPSGSKKLKQFNITGIYFLVKNNIVVYVGQSVDIHSRVKTHINEKHKNFDSIHYLECPEYKLDYMEMKMIIRFKPKYNKQGMKIADRINKFKNGKPDKIKMKDLVYL